MTSGAGAGVGAPELTAEQIDGWTRDGFLILDHFIDADTLSTLRVAYDEILSGEVAAAGDRRLGGITRQVLWPSSAHPVFDRNQAVDRAIATTRRLFGTEHVARTFDMLIYKPPGHPHATPWHQDLAYGAQPFAEAGTAATVDSIQFWVPLDDVDNENGCMQFVPGHHTGTLFEHHVASGDPEDEGRLLALVAPATQIDLSKAVVAEIPAGGATLHTVGTPHYTGANRSADRPRRSYIFNIKIAVPETDR